MADTNINSLRDRFAVAFDPSDSRRDAPIEEQVLHLTQAIAASALLHDNRMARLEKGLKTLSEAARDLFEIQSRRLELEVEAADKPDNLPY